MDANAKPTPKPRLRWFQYRLRTLLILMTVFGIWFGTLVKRANDQKRAVAAIKAAGGNVYYDYDYFTGEPPGPAWLRNLLGDDYFTNVVGVIHVTEAKNVIEIDALHGIRVLRFVELAKDVTDNTLLRMSEFPEIKGLTVIGPNITDDGLAVFEHLPELEDLSLVTCDKITDNGLEHLKALLKLHDLCVTGKNVTAEGLAKLKRTLPKLQSVVGP